MKASRLLEANQSLESTKMVARIFIAWLVGSVAYMFAMVLSVYDGLLSMIFQPIIGAVISAIVVMVATPFVYLLLRFDGVRQICRTLLPSVAVTSLGFALIGLSSADGFAQIRAGPNTGEPFRVLHFAFFGTGFIGSIIGPLLLPIGMPDDRQS